MLIQILTSKRNSFSSDCISYYNYATHYSYDVHGNVKTLWQDNPPLGNILSSVGAAGQRFKRIDYDYDLVSGKVNDVYYQHDSLDAFAHHNEYDADNKLTQVYTSKYPDVVWTGVQGDPFWDNDVKYYFYKHGPIARVELGNEKVQGIDYAYTLQGWIKGVNSETLDSTRDIGQDGNPVIGNNNTNFAKDAFGYSLNYFSGDYSAIGGTNANKFLASKASMANLATDAPGLYNGNINYMVTTITNPTMGKALPQLTSYKYDQLNRLKEMKAYDSINFTTNTWVGTTYVGMYHNIFSYDANGNIEKALANNRAGVAIDKQTYHYQTVNGNKVSNRLYAINDSTTVTSGNDLLNQLAFDTTATTMNTVNNYSYDEVGELKTNKQDSIADIEWTVQGKIKSITRTAGCHKYNLKFDYDPAGKRIAKHVYKSDNTWVSSEYYIKDEQSNIMSTYKYSVDDITQTAHFKQTELHIYGTGPVGIDRGETELIATQPAGSIFTHSLGNKQFSGNNHLSNSLVIFTDRKIQHSDGNGNVAFYTTFIVESNDYAPFGGLLTERTFNKDVFPNSFNGKRDDPELGDWQDYGARIYSPWMRKFVTLDPLMAKFPFMTPYAFAENDPISCIDLDGLEKATSTLGPSLSSSAFVVYTAQLTANGSWVVTHTVYNGTPAEVQSFQRMDQNARPITAHQAKIMNKNATKGLNWNYLNNPNLMKKGTVKTPNTNQATFTSFIQTDPNGPAGVLPSPGSAPAVGNGVVNSTPIPALPAGAVITSQNTSTNVTATANVIGGGTITGTVNGTNVVVQNGAGGPTIGNTTSPNPAVNVGVTSTAGAGSTVTFQASSTTTTNYTAPNPSAGTNTPGAPSTPTLVTVRP
jgi:RHS repeat-associated protein